MRPIRAAAALTGGALGAAMATAAAASRRVARQRSTGPRGEPLDTRQPDREHTVTTDDGVALHVAEVDPADGARSDLTVVLVHGYSLDHRCWHFQRRDLARTAAPRVRQVLYDHRCHGRSGRCPDDAATIEQLGRDLATVLDAAAPDEPVVLVGHSMGGMTIMALAEQRPDLFTDRVRGVALLNTAAGDVGSAGLARPALSAYNPALAAAGVVAARYPRSVERGRALGDNLLWAANRALTYGARSADNSVVDLIHRMISDTPVDVLTAFLPTLDRHNRYGALAGLVQTESLVLGGDADPLTPYHHAEAIAALLPDAELVQIRRGGHMAMLEHPALVTDALTRLLSRCAGAASRRSA